MARESLRRREQEDGPFESWQDVGDRDLPFGEPGDETVDDVADDLPNIADVAGIRVQEERARQGCNLGISLRRQPLASGTGARTIEGVEQAWVLLPSTLVANMPS